MFSLKFSSESSGVDYTTYCSNLQQAVEIHCKTLRYHHLREIPVWACFWVALSARLRQSLICSNAAHHLAFRLGCSREAPEKGADSFRCSRVSVFKRSAASLLDDCQPHLMLALPGWRFCESGAGVVLAKQLAACRGLLHESVHYATHTASKRHNLRSGEWYFPSYTDRMEGECLTWNKWPFVLSVFVVIVQIFIHKVGIWN